MIEIEPLLGPRKPESLINMLSLDIRLFAWFLRRFLKQPWLFLYILNYLPFEVCWPDYLNKLKSSSLNIALFQVWHKLALYFKRRR